MSQRGSESSIGSLSAEQLVSVSRQLAGFPPGAVERGRRYAQNGSILALTFDGSAVRATVAGTELYTTVWEWRDGRWRVECTCPIGAVCKHAFAVGCCVVAGRSDGAALEPRVASLLPTKVRFGATSVAVTRQAGSLAAVATPFQSTVVRIADRRTRAVDRGPGAAALGRLRAATTSWERHQALAQLLARAPVYLLAEHGDIRAIVYEAETDPDVLCWRLARAVDRRTGGWLPPALEPFRDRPDLVARAVERARESLLEEVRRWASTQRDRAARHLRVVLDLEGDVDGLGVTIEARLTSARLVDTPRNPTQLLQLRSEAYQHPGLLPPAQLGLLEWLTETAAAVPYGRQIGLSRRVPLAALQSFLGRLADPSFAALASWSSEIDPTLASIGGVTPGGPVAHGTAPVRLLPVCISRDGVPWLELRFVWPDGRSRTANQLLWLRDGSAARNGPSLVLADGMLSIVSEQPPRALLDRFGDVGAVALSPEVHQGVLGALAERFPHIAETVRRHTRVHRAMPVVSLDLRSDDWLQVRAFACAGIESWTPPSSPPASGVVFEYGPDHVWRRLAAPEGESPHAIGTAAGDTSFVRCDGGSESDASATSLPTAASPNADVVGNAGAIDDVWLDSPEPETVAPVIEWLRSLEAKPAAFVESDGIAWPDRDVGWWLKLTRKRMEAFAAAWERRSTASKYFGTERTRRLLSGAAVVRPRVRVHASGLDWLSVSADWESEGAQLSDDDLARLRSTTARFVRLEHGWIRREAAEQHDALAGMLADLGIEVGRGEQRLSMWQLAGARSESLETLMRLDGLEETMQALAELRRRVDAFAGLPAVRPPKGLIGELRPYQRRGVDFLAYTSSLGLGAVLADDMGLGKTIQTLAWIEHLRAAAPGAGPCLVVCPASVVHNWAREAQKFVPKLRVLLLERGATRHALRAAIPSHDLIVTTYALLRRDLDAWRDVELRAVVLDEAQNIKNPDAVVTRAALTLRAQHRLALTGTPLENRALDLWSIVSFVNPGYLGTRAEFASRFDRLDAPPHLRTLLAAKLRPILLRRLKSQVATDLPERIEERRDCELTRGQRQLYLAELKRSRAVVAKLGADAAALGRNKIVILAALTRLRQICCHPALGGGSERLGSGKFDALAELLEPILAEGHKVLVFSQFVRCLRLLRTDLERRGVVCHVLTGETVRRDAVVTAFTDDPRPCVFLISLKAGGTGLNLTSASYVVLFDPWWNPAVEAQAIDRTHRIGQDRTVIAYRLLALGTIEEKIWELQQRKAALARDVLGEDGFSRTLTRDDLRYLLDDD